LQKDCNYTVLQPFRHPLCNLYYFVCKHLTNKVAEKRGKIKFLIAIPQSIERYFFPEKKYCDVFSKPFRCLCKVFAMVL
jgi:hypothetical protein